jgi:hypothetical protein
MPLTHVASSIATVLPPDEVIIESTDISGIEAFEVLVSVHELAGMYDPLCEPVLEVVKKHAANVLPALGGDQPAAWVPHPAGSLPRSVQVMPRASRNCRTTSSNTG